VAAWARDEGLPVATHLAEAPGEAALFRDATGAFAAMWSRRGIPLPDRPATPVEWLDRHDALGPSVLCVHVVHAAAADVALLARRGVAVAHCPLSNRVHAHGDAPIGALLEAGIRVGCGTDSVVSVGSLDLLAAARAARALARLDAAGALALCTIGAARALALEGELGSLTAGKWGDAAILRIGSASDPSAALERALATGPAEVIATLVSGREVFRTEG
ncbi:MAG TPA: amidohydrolase family protein, partial [Gemmatimonadales bacterium]